MYLNFNISYLEDTISLGGTEKSLDFSVVAFWLLSSPIFLWQNVEKIMQNPGKELYELQIVE